MAYQGEYFIERYGKEAVARTPPIRLMLAAGLPVGGTPMYPEQNRLDRMEALRRYTVGSSWFSSEDDRKGALMPGQFADFAALTDDYFTIDEPQIKYLTSSMVLPG
jgi:predicted amidohydrolase YtcJ